MLKKIIRYQAVVCILVGIISIMAGFYLGHVTELSQLQKLQQSQTTGCQFFTLRVIAGATLETIGVGLVLFGLFNVLLETKDWKNYFQARLKEIVVEQDYLNRLDKDTLKQLQVSVLKAIFKNKDVDKEGSFLNYFHNHLHNYIAEPYREDVSVELIIKETADKKKFSAYDKVTYVCRMAGGKIQSHIKWKPEKEEFSKILSLVFKVKYPVNHPKAGQEENLLEMDSEAVAKIINEGQAVTQDLDKFSNIDGLIVIVESEYEFLKDRFGIWQMAHPTKNFDFTISYEGDYTVQMTPLLLTPEVCHKTEQDHYVKIKCDSWMLPWNGICYKVLSKSAS